MATRVLCSSVKALAPPYFAIREPLRVRPNKAWRPNLFGMSAWCRLAHGVDSKREDADDDECRGPHRI